MAVYFIQSGDDGPVKIGTAEVVADRVRELQCGNPQPLNLLRVIDGGRRTEAWLHRHFKASRLRSEWFAISDEMLTVEPPAEVVADARGAPAGIIETLGGARRIASMCLIPRQTVENWKARNSIPSWHHKMLLDEAKRLGIALTADDFLAAHAEPRPVADPMQIAS